VGKQGTIDYIKLGPFSPFFCSATEKQHQSVTGHVSRLWKPYRMALFGSTCNSQHRGQGVSGNTAVASPTRFWNDVAAKPSHGVHQAQYANQCCFMVLLFVLSVLHKWSGLHFDA
jgi:hypothetical protein